MRVDPGNFLNRIGATLSADGKVAQLNLVNENGKKAFIQFPTSTAGTVLLDIEQALGQLFEKQRVMLKGEDPRCFFGVCNKNVVKIQGAIAEGHPVVSFVLKSDLRLDFVLDRNLLRGLIEWLQDVEADLDKAPAPRN
jgi:hypothetical protein